MLRGVARATMPIRSPPNSVVPALSFATSVPMPVNADIGVSKRGRNVHPVTGHDTLVTFASQMVDQVFSGPGHHPRTHLALAMVPCLGRVHLV